MRYGLMVWYGEPYKGACFSQSMADYESCTFFRGDQTSLRIGVWDLDRRFHLMCLDWGIFLSDDDGFMSYSHSSEEIGHSFHIGVWDVFGIFHLMYSTQRHTPLRLMMDFWAIVILLEMMRFSFHIRVRDMTGWFFFMWLYWSIDFSSVLIDFWDDLIRAYTCEGS